MSARTVSVVDRSRGIMPRACDRESTAEIDPAVQLKLSQLRAKAKGRDGRGIVELALRESFPGRTAIISSFGSESVALLHLVAQVDPTAPVLFLNTGKLFGETLRYRDRLQDELGLVDIRSIGPHPTDRERVDPDGTLWSRDTDACCNFRKVVPIKLALNGFDAQITGRKKFQTKLRAEMQAVEYFEGRFRFNPLAEWTLKDIETYAATHNLPRHPLVDDGYPSIGCMPCTHRVAAGGGYRDCRLAGLDKDGCGIHSGVDGDV